MPRGESMPKLFASGANAFLRFSSHALRFLKPPTSARFSSGEMYSSTLSLRQHLLLELDDEVDVPGVQGVVAQDRLRDRALGLELGEAAQPVDQAVEVAAPDPR